MKKSCIYRKTIFKRIANKSFRRRLRSKHKKKQKNKRLLGANKQQRKEKNIKQHFQQQFVGYKHIKAPATFSLTHNTEESLDFIAKIEECFKKKKKVFVNLEKVETIAHGAIVVMLSILVKFKEGKIDFNGNFPKNKKAAANLKKSGFFKYLGEDFKEQDEYSFENEICTHAKRKVDSQLSDEIIKRASNFVWKEERRCTGLQRVFIELMQNTNNHASNTSKGEHHWWATIYYSKEDNKVCFAFIDYGVGILRSLESNKEGHKFFGIIPKLKKAFNPSTNADILKLLLNGEVHKTATGKYYRGKGLPGIFDACKNNKISNLVIISNDAIADYSKDKYESLNNELSGTFVYWELNADNVNIK